MTNNYKSGSISMRSSFLFHIMVFLLINTIAFSQNVNLSGFVKDASSGDPLVGANVYIVGTSLGTASNEKGFYKLPNISEGTYIVRAEYIGYMMMFLFVFFSRARKTIKLKLATQNRKQIS